MTIEERLERLEVLLTEIIAILSSEISNKTHDQVKKDIEDKFKDHRESKHIWP